MLAAMARSHKIRSRILQWVGIPCGIGIGATKTLAKLANHVAKTAERKPGSYPAVCCGPVGDTLGRSEFGSDIFRTVNIALLRNIR